MKQAFMSVSGYHRGVQNEELSLIVKIKWISILLLVLLVAACDDVPEGNSNPEQVNQEVARPITDANRPQRPASLQTATVNRVIDGDTVELADGQRVRLIGINTPEQDEPLYDEATTFTRDLLQGKEVGIEYGAAQVDQYDRALMYLWVGDKLANYEIARAGYAKRYYLPPNVEYDFYIQQAVEASRSAQIGLWKTGVASLKIDLVVANPPGPDEENLNGELVRLVNTSNQALDMDGYTIRDEGSNVYTFRDFTLPPGGLVTVYTGCGQITTTNLFWCATAPIWNNSGDTVFIHDSNGLYITHQELLGR